MKPDLTRTPDIDQAAPGEEADSAVRVQIQSHLEMNVDAGITAPREMPLAMIGELAQITQMAYCNRVPNHSEERVVGEIGGVADQGPQQIGSCRMAQMLRGCEVFVIADTGTGLPLSK